VSKTYRILLSMLKNRLELDLPYYDGLLAGYYRKEPGYTSRRVNGTDDWLLVATLGGLGRFGTAVGDLPAEPGQLTLVSPGTPHDYGIAKGGEIWEILWVHFQPLHEWLELLNWPSPAPGVASLTPSPDAWPAIESCFHEVHNLSFSTGRRRRQFAMNALERLLLLCEAELPTHGQPIDDRVRTAIEYVHVHLGESLSIEDLSDRVHLSPSRFSHLFRSQTGMAPLQYIGLQRMRRAATLLERTTLSIAEIAAAVGMEPFHFSARFKAQTGSNPRAYRATLLATEIR